ncbi:XRE family transcriptional regulator [Cereibacter sphaeroides]|uniref:XRE family transcriptional regulator n=1 Tax=Cereibacter sphaeroides TaxID=1063 RepID=A0AAX1UNA2_CERSP|nr:helix-turn-helix transcriptional regulator [Cereibacter sphaeroides]RHZ96485.1 XRE family transcriptional regulator [Cereibacter sphaeroides]
MERDIIVMIVARNIEAAMDRKGLSAPEVARRAGINPTGVYDILKGKSRSPRLDTIHKIAVQGLGIPMSALFVEPTDEELDQELAETLGMLPTDERRKFLAMARAYTAPHSET